MTSCDISENQLENAARIAREQEWSSRIAFVYADSMKLEEMFAEKGCDWPFWISYSDIAKGVTVPPEEVDRMHDWRNNPMAALPNWFCIAAQK